jgi:hypothetical protein
LMILDFRLTIPDLKLIFEIVIEVVKDSPETNRRIR